MARKKSSESIDAEIFKIKSDMSKLQDRYDKLVKAQGTWEPETANRDRKHNGRLSEKRQKI